MKEPKPANPNPLNVDAVSTGETTQLRRWNSTGRAGRGDKRFTSVLLGMSAIALVLAVFTASVFRPLAMTGITVLCIGPKPQSDAEAAPALQSQASRAIRSATAFHNFASELATAETLPPITIAAATGVGLDEWMLDRISQRPMLVHLVGAAVMDHGRAFIVPHRDATSARPSSVDIAALIEDLAAGENPSLLVIDAVDDRGQSVMRLPEFTAWQFNRVINDSVARWSEGNLLVVVSHCNPDSTTVSASVTPPAVTPMTTRLQTSFSQSADNDGDGIIVIDEWLQSVTRKQKLGSTHDTTRWFASRDFASWRNLKISPIHASTDPPQTASTKDETPQTPEVVVDQASPSVHLDITAPSMAMAIGMLQTGIATKNSDRAAETASQLKSYLGVEDSIVDMTDWLHTPNNSSLRWNEIEWARTVVQLNLPAPTQKNLIRARVLAMQLSCDPLTRQVLSKRWDVAQWTRLDAERNATSPVRSDSVDYVGKQVQKCLSLLQETQADIQVVRQTTDQLKDIRQSINAWIGRPVLARTPSDDATCKLLRVCCEAQNWLRQPSGDTANTFRGQLARINELLPAIDDSEHASRSMKTASQASEPANERFLQITGVRVQRAMLALRLKQAGTETSAVSLLDEAATNALTVLASAASSEAKIDSAMTDFRMAVAHCLRSDGMGKTTTLRESASDDWLGRLRDAALDASRYSVDSAMQERDARAKICDRCRRLAVGIGGSISANVDQSVSATARVSDSLAISPIVDVDVSIEFANDGAARGYWSIEQDSHLVSIESFDGEPIGAELWQAGTQVAHQIRPQHKSGSPSAVSHSRKRLRFRLRRQPGVDRDTAVNVRWINSNGPHRISIPLQMPLPPIATVEIGPSDGSANDTSDDWAMHANRTQYQSLQLNVTDLVATTLRVRLLAWEDPTIEIPPTMRENEAKRWLGGQIAPQTIATIDALPVSADWRVPLVFPPKKLKPTDPVIPIGALVCELTDLDREIVQMINLRPQVHRPSSLVMPKVSFDHHKRVVEILLDPTSVGVPEDPTIVTAEIKRESTEQVLANTTVAVSSLHASPKPIRLSTANSNGDAFFVRLSVDGWPSAFVYRIAGDQSVSEVQAAEDHAAVQLLSPSTLIVPRTEMNVKAKVFVDVTDHLFRYGVDEINLGLDIDGDRFLSNEPKATVRTPVDVRFRWAGIAPDGSVGIRSIVAPHELAVPLGVLTNRRVSVIATLHRGDIIDYSKAAVAVLDQLPPKVDRVEIKSTVPTVVGTVVECDVTVNDVGLSEAADVLAGWAINGRQDFSAEVKAIKGQQLSDGRWTVSLPTDGLASGQHTLLVRATDRAGNIGDAATIIVPIRTAAEIELSELNSTTVVRGSVSFVKLPVSDMQVTLERQQEVEKANVSNPPNPAGMPNDPISLTSKQDLKGTTGSDGHFTISNVTAGRYALTVEGLYRGVRRRKTVQIAVQPPQPTTVPNLRVD